MLLLQKYNKHSKNYHTLHYMQAYEIRPLFDSISEDTKCIGVKVSQLIINDKTNLSLIVGCMFRFSISREMQRVIWHTTNRAHFFFIHEVFM